jgi:hypothetical protein
MPPKRKSPRKKAAPEKAPLQVESYVEECKDILGLKDWTIRYQVVADPADGALADIRPDRGKIAYLRLAKNFFSDTPSNQRNTIAHELLHVLLSRVDDTVYSLDSTLAPCTWKLFETNYVEASEDAVQVLSHLIEKLLPLPSWH